jgi:hypothetical protein
MALSVSVICRRSAAVVVALEPGWQAVTRASAATIAVERMSPGMAGTGMRGEPEGATQREYADRANSFRVREIGQRFVRGSGRTVGLFANAGT